jgi:hypothetical protein
LFFEQGTGFPVEAQLAHLPVVTMGLAQAFSNTADSRTGKIRAGARRLLMLNGMLRRTKCSVSGLKAQVK